MLKKRLSEYNDDIEMTGEDSIDEIQTEEIEEKSAAKVSELKKKLKESEEARRALMEDLQRAKADFLNARKRLEEEKNTDRERARVKHIEELLPLVDSFEAALKDEVLNGAAENLQKGIFGIYSQLQNLFRGYNVSEVEALGETFNPAFHEAVAEVPVGDKASDHKVIAVVQKGYRMNDALIRPARVTVGIYKN